MREHVLSDTDRLAALKEADQTFPMTEQAFRAFYEQTARPVWAYLVRATGDARLADDLLQETYYRFLRSRSAFDGDDHRRRYLFRIATNLVHDSHRRLRHGARPLGPLSPEPVAPAGDVAELALRRLDLARAFSRMKPRDRSLLWLAYAEGLSHEELAGVLGVKKASLKALLFRARKRLLGLLRGHDSQRGQP